MFSGIVEELGVVRKISRRAYGCVLEIECGVVAEGAGIGESICVNGVCLTVTAVKGPVLNFDAVVETLKSSTTGFLRVSDRVNLERSLKVGDRIGGHFVSGHVDCTGVIRSKRMNGGGFSLDIVFPVAYRGCVIPKGSIAVDGVSLTIGAVRSDTFTVNIIPHTWRATALQFRAHASKVNLEFDMLLKQKQVTG